METSRKNPSASLMTSLKIICVCVPNIVAMATIQG